MPTNPQKVIFYAPPDLVALLDAESERTGQFASCCVVSSCNSHVAFH